MNVSYAVYCSWRFSRYIERFAAWPQKIVWNSSAFAYAVSSYQVSCDFLQLCLYLTALFFSACSILCFHPALLIMICCELGKKISKFIMCYKKKYKKHPEARVMWVSFSTLNYLTFWLLNNQEKSLFLCLKLVDKVQVIWNEYCWWYNPLSYFKFSDLLFLLLFALVCLIRLHTVATVN